MVVSNTESSNSKGAAVKEGRLTRTISSTSASLIIVGYVVGATIFILPGSLAADAGPSIYLAYMLAAIPAVFSSFVMAQVGSAFPVSGAIYVLIHEALSPRIGFIYLWIMISLSATIIPLVAVGFADYFAYFFPGIGTKTTAVAVTVIFILLNSLGMSVASSIQNALVLAFIAALAVFAVGGIASGDATLLKPMFPNGFPVLAVAAVTAYFSYGGIYVIAEIAGEIRNPARNIPRAIALSLVIIVVIYAVVPLALTMVVPWKELGGTDMAIVTAAGTFLPAPLVIFIAAGALFAAATSINGIILGLSRDLYQGAVTGPFPRVCGIINKRTQAPVYAILLVGALAIAGIAAGGTVTDYAQVTVMGIVIIQIMTGIALIRLPSKLPDVFSGSKFRLRYPALVFVSTGYILISVFFLGILATEQKLALVLVTGYVLVGLIYYSANKSFSRRFSSGSIQSPD